MDQPNLIRTPEKRELAILISKKYNSVISDLNQTENFQMAQLLEAIKEKLKVEAMQMEIKHLEEKKVLIEKKIAELGFEYAYGTVKDLTKRWEKNDQVVDYSTPAGKLYYKLCKARPDVRKLESQKDEAIGNLWLSETKGEVRKLLNAKVVPMLSKPTPKKMIEA